MFQDRSDAGMQLATRLRKDQHVPGLILAVPKGGVPVAYEVAKALHLPLELVMVKKLGHPLNKEYAIGAVGLRDRFVVPQENVSIQYIEEETRRVRCSLLEMQQKFIGDKAQESLTGKTLVIIEDGIATGNTLLSTIQILKKDHPSGIIIATPVVSRSAVMKLRGEVDELIALLIPDHFIGVGAFYKNFTQVTDEEVLHYLKKLHKLHEFG